MIDTKSVMEYLSENWPRQRGWQDSWLYQANPPTVWAEAYAELVKQEVLEIHPSGKSCTDPCCAHLKVEAYPESTYPFHVKFTPNHKWVLALKGVKAK